jgi:hypothetical protein
MTIFLPNSVNFMFKRLGPFSGAIMGTSPERQDVENERAASEGSSCRVPAELPKFTLTLEHS